ncbi:unnamed protein product [Sphagnum troendelagicum]|uniref:Germin-like protein n=1 Tax=Sphagnum troendelagicum TaxID=128251 RepID=A0ABP0UCF6_9BRYO
MDYSCHQGSKGSSRQAADWRSATVAFAYTTLLIVASSVRMVQAADPDPLQISALQTCPRMLRMKCVVHRYKRLPTDCECLTVPLNTLGISHGRLDFDIGGVIPPHTHPFASETLFVVKGTIYTGFISFDNILYAETLQEGDVYIFPKGSLHFQLNVGNGPAVTFNSLNSQNPGFLSAANQLLVTKIPEKVLETSIGNAKTLKLLQDSVPLSFGGSR